MTNYAIDVSADALSHGYAAEALYVMSGPCDSTTFMTESEVLTGAISSLVPCHSPISSRRSGMYAPSFAGPTIAAVPSVIVDWLGLPNASGVPYAGDNGHTMHLPCARSTASDATPVVAAVNARVGTVSMNWLATIVPWLYMSGAISETVNDSALTRYFSHDFANPRFSAVMAASSSCATPASESPGVNHPDVVVAESPALPAIITTGVSGC